MPASSPPAAPGEGFSLTPAESARVVRMAVEEVGSRVPVLASAGGSTAQAIQNAQDAEAAGAEGLLLLPPYLTECDQAGLIDHVSAPSAPPPARRHHLQPRQRHLQARHRGRAGRPPRELHRLQGRRGRHRTPDAKVYAKLGDRLFYLGGLPTAETFALPLLQLGMSTYSRAMYNFVPRVRPGLLPDVRNQDRDRRQQEAQRFVIPYLDIRDRVKGYGVSIVKGGLEAIGRAGGLVRPPLQDLTAQDLADLTALIDAAGIRPADAVLQNA